MSKNKKKYRHGIEMKPATKTKIKKHELLRRIEALEEKLNGRPIDVQIPDHIG